MRAGKITLTDRGPERDVRLKIEKDELFSDFPQPPCTIKSSAVSSYEMVEEREAGKLYYHLHVVCDDSTRFLFYTAETQYDIALLLDEFEAALGRVPRSLIKTEPAGRPNAAEPPREFGCQ